MSDRETTRDECGCWREAGQEAIADLILLARAYKAAMGWQQGEVADGLEDGMRQLHEAGAEGVPGSLDLEALLAKWWPEVLE